MSAVSDAEIAKLCELSPSDRAINDATQVISFFNYINRIADGLGVDLEDGMPRLGKACSHTFLDGFSARDQS